MKNNKIMKRKKGNALTDFTFKQKMIAFVTVVGVIALGFLLKVLIDFYNYSKFLNY